MDPKAAGNAQRDQQWSATAEDAVRAHVESALKDTHTCLPGIVKSFDPDTQTVTVQAALQRTFIDVGIVNLPLCVDVPVVFPAGGNFVLTFPIDAGDECLLIFSERAIDFWWDRGDVQLPSEYRLHDLSDAFALVGVSSRLRFLPAVATDAVELRTRAGDTVVRMENDTVYVGGKTGAELAVKGETYRQAEDALIAALNTFAGVLSGACTGVATLPQAATAINAIGPAASGLQSAIATFQAGVSTYLATKAKVL